VISEISLEGYDLTSMNIDEACGRGLVLYTATWLNASQYIPSTPAQESVWCTVQLRGQDKLIIGCVYQSPTSLPANDEAINDVIRNTATSNKCLHILIMGDFNYPNVCWNTWMTFASHDVSDYKFVETMKNFLISACVEANKSQDKSNTECS